MASSFSQSLFSDEADRSLLVPDNLNLLCSPCEVDHKAVPAVGYCVDCSEHLCARCYSYHRTLSVCRKHKLLDKHHMPRTKTYKDECTDECEIHVGEVLKFFCEDHQQFICSACVIAESRLHKRCKVGYIPKLSKDLFDNQEFRDFENNLKLLKKQTCDIETSAKKNLVYVDTYANRSIESFRQYRKEINQFLDKQEKHVIDQCSRSKKYNEEKISPLVNQSKHLGDKIEEIEKRIKEKKEKNQKCSLYFDMKNFMTQLKEYSAEITTLEQNNQIREFSVSPTKLIRIFLSEFSQRSGIFVDVSRLFGMVDGVSVLPAMQLTDEGGCCFDDIALLSDERIALVTRKTEK